MQISVEGFETWNRDIKNLSKKSENSFFFILYIEVTIFFLVTSFQKKHCICESRKYAYEFPKISEHYFYLFL